MLLRRSGGIGLQRGKDVNDRVWGWGERGFRGKLELGTVSVDEGLRGRDGLLSGME